jgi:hypothetical protein
MEFRPAPTEFAPAPRNQETNQLAQQQLLVSWRRIRHGNANPSMGDR